MVSSYSFPDRSSRPRRSTRTAVTKKQQEREQRTRANAGILEALNRGPPPEIPSRVRVDSPLQIHEDQDQDLAGQDGSASASASALALAPAVNSGPVDPCRSELTSQPRPLRRSKRLLALSSSSSPSSPAPQVNHPDPMQSSPSSPMTSTAPKPTASNTNTATDTTKAMPSTNVAPSTTSSEPTPLLRLVTLRRRLLHTLEIKVAHLPRDGRNLNRSQIRLCMFRDGLRGRTRGSGRLIHRPDDVRLLVEVRDPTENPDMIARFAWFWGDETARSWQRQSVAFRMERRRERNDWEDATTIMKGLMRKRARRAFRRQNMKKKEIEERLSGSDVEVTKVVSNDLDAGADNDIAEYRQIRDSGDTHIEADFQGDIELVSVLTDADSDQSSSIHDSLRHDDGSADARAQQKTTPNAIQPARSSAPVYNDRHPRLRPRSYLDTINEFSELWSRFENDDRYSTDIELEYPTMRPQYASSSMTVTQTQHDTNIPSPLRINRPVSEISASSMSTSAQRGQVSTSEYWRRKAARLSGSTEPRPHQARRSMDWEYYDEGNRDEYHNLLSSMATGSRRSAGR